MSSTTFSSDTPLQILKKYWGYTSFRPLQAEIIASILSDHDTIALLPTGGGKSVCYQVPALVKGGVSIVISPLIALMMDQVNQLTARGIKAVALHSGMHRQDIERHLTNATRGGYQLLYCSPERLQTPLFQGHLPYMDIGLVAVDEAHCISQWGHDFRPSYRMISDMRTYVPDVPFLAVTATATPQVVDDIKEQLALQNPNQFRRSFARENIQWLVIHELEEMDRLVQLVKAISGSMIVYAGSRLRTARIADFLRKRNIAALHYHGGLEPEERAKRQQAWMNNEVKAIVSTNAFGMGVDKPDVRAVIHMDLPQSPEAYYQEAGRAGRDGIRSFAILLWSKNKVEEAEEVLERTFPSESYCREVYHILGSYYKIAFGDGKMSSFPFVISAFAKKYGLSVFEVFYALKMIQLSGWIELSEQNLTRSKIKVINYKDVSHISQYNVSLLHLLLRTYEGILIDYVRINEFQLARLLDVDQVKIVQSLQELERKGVLQYHQATEGMAIQFLEDRVQKRRFRLDRKAIHQQKKQAEVRRRAMKQYIEAQTCRTKVLLTYFGEENKEDCGSCDVCLGSLKRKFDSVRKEEVQQKILALLDHQKPTVRELLRQFSFLYEERLLSLLQEMEQQDIIRITDQYRVQKSTK